MREGGKLEYKCHYQFKNGYQEFWFKPVEQLLQVNELGYIWNRGFFNKKTCCITKHGIQDSENQILKLN